MRKILVIASFMIGLVACGPHTYNTYSNGKGNDSFIIVLTAGQSFDNVSVIIDGTSFPVDKVYPVKSTIKAHPIVTTPGKHQVKVVADGKTVSDESVFLGLQETKKIVLR